MLTHVDLFSGIGGFALAAEWAGFKTVVFCEIDEFCQKVLKKHWPEVCIVSNVKEMDGTRWGKTTLLSAGFPCQDLSRASFGSKMNLEGKESGLFFQVARIVNESLPQYILIENVSRILRFMNVISNAMSRYHFYGEILNAENFGVLCRRPRAFIVGSLRKGSATEIFTIVKKRQATLSGRRTQDILPMCLPWKGGPSLERLASCLVENTETNPTRIRAGNGISRQLDSRRYLTLGNSIVPQVAYEIIKGIAEIENEKTRT